MPETFDNILRHGGRPNQTGFLFASDVDGTLLTADYRLLPQVRDAVRHASANGVSIMLATARGPAALDVVLADLGPVDYAICFGGALVLERRENAWAPALPDRICLEVSDAADVWHVADGLGIGVGAYTETGVHIAEANPWFENELAHTGEPVFMTPFGSITDPIFKLLAISDPQRTDDLERLRAQLPAGVEGVYSHPNYLEIMVEGASKGEALQRFCSSRALDRSKVVVTGDGDNDVSMFLSAGHSVAMSHASAAARAAARWTVAPGAPAGVAAVIDHYASSLWRIPSPPNP